jgi:hypothetical protein
MAIRRHHSISESDEMRFVPLSQESHEIPPVPDRFFAIAPAPEQSAFQFADNEPPEFVRQFCLESKSDQWS